MIIPDESKNRVHIREFSPLRTLFIYFTCLIFIRKNKKVSCFHQMLPPSYSLSIDCASQKNSFFFATFLSNFYRPPSSHQNTKFFSDHQAHWRRHQLGCSAVYDRSILLNRASHRRAVFENSILSLSPASHTKNTSQFLLARTSSRTRGPPSRCFEGQTRAIRSPKAPRWKLMEVAQHHFELSRWLYRGTFKRNVRDECNGHTSTGATNLRRVANKPAFILIYRWISQKPLMS